MDFLCSFSTYCTLYSLPDLGWRLLWDCQDGWRWLYNGYETVICNLHSTISLRWSELPNHFFFGYRGIKVINLLWTFNISIFFCKYELTCNDPSEPFWKWVSSKVRGHLIERQAYKFIYKYPFRMFWIGNNHLELDVEKSYCVGASIYIKF